MTWAASTNVPARSAGRSREPIRTAARRTRRVKGANGRNDHDLAVQALAKEEGRVARGEAGWRSGHSAALTPVRHSRSTLRWATATGRKDRSAKRCSHASE